MDGTLVELPRWHWYPHRWAGGAFTADYGQVQGLLPSPPLHPVRVSRKRALVCASGAYIPTVGDEAPFFGFGEVAVMAFVTCGEKPAPPLVPGLSRSAMHRYGFGFFPLAMLVTNRVAAELYRLLLGIPAHVADVRVEQRLDRERFVCEDNGRLVCDLTVRSDGRPSAGRPGARDWFYAAEHSDVYRVAVGASGVSRSRLGAGAASVIVGDHPLAETVRRLNLSRAWASEFVPDRHLWLTGPPERNGRAGRQLVTSARRDVLRASLVISPTPGVEFEADQGIDSLRWNPEGVFTGPGLHDQASR